MAFDIHQRVFDRNGERLEKKSQEYLDQLMDLFVQSPEGQALEKEGFAPGWAYTMMDYGISYLGATPPHITPAGLREILFELFPRKVSTPADSAEGIIRELHAFWTFLQREFHLANAAANLKVLDEKTARQLKRELSDPANFGIAKSFVMMGLERGFDLSTQEGINVWMATYNAELAKGGLRIPLPGEQSTDAQKFHDRLRQRKSRPKRARKRK